MAVIGKYSIKDLEINKNEINKKFFKDNKNSKILDIFNEIKSCLSNTDYSIEENIILDIKRKNNGQIKKYY